MMPACSLVSYHIDLRSPGTSLICPLRLSDDLQGVLLQYISIHFMFRQNFDRSFRPRKVAPANQRGLCSGQLESCCKEG